MPKILTPLSLFKNFDVSLPTFPVKLSSTQINDMRIEHLNISGRETGCGRVQIAAAFAYDVQSPAAGTVLIFPDSTETIDEEILKFFVAQGFTALMVDYRGEWKDATFVTRYPSNVSYANTVKCGRQKDYVDDSADKTSWYEWVGIGLYAQKYIKERTGSDNIAVVGLRDGGEIAWKLGVAGDFSCIIPVCAAGWKAYSGISKYMTEDPVLDEERYRFIAGIDSQAYAPHVKCPVLMLCSTNDPRFDYDRAYDTFSRINQQYIKDSAIAFSVKSSASIGAKSIADMFLMLDKNLKKRQVFIPKPPEVSVFVDEKSNLVAKVTFDNKGIAESCKLYLAEDCIDSTLREWCVCTEKSRKAENIFEYYLNVYEKTTTIFVLCRVRYLNGFTVWSKMIVKKISGLFRNTQCKCRVMYNDKDAADDFAVADSSSLSIGGIFFPDESVLPRFVTKTRGIKGLYSPCGLSTFRMSNPKFAPSKNSVLSIDFFCDETSVLTLTFIDIVSGEQYVNEINVVGGAWQTIISESKNFKTESGVPLSDFTGDLKFTLTCEVGYAVNNIMWL